MIDGGSTDGTLELIAANTDIVSIVISEKDKGIYDAMNKGVKASSAPYLMFLNAGDTLYTSTTLENMIQISNEQVEDLLYGDVVVKKSSQQWVKRQPHNLGLRYLFVNNLCHQSIVFKRELFELYGDFDIRETILADFKFLLTLVYSGKVTSRHIDQVICQYPLNGVSSQKSLIYNYINRSRIIKQIVKPNIYRIYQCYWMIAKPFTVFQNQWNRLLARMI